MVGAFAGMLEVGSVGRTHDNIITEQSAEERAAKEEPHTERRAINVATRAAVWTGDKRSAGQVFGQVRGAVAGALGRNAAALLRGFIRPRRFVTLPDAT